MVATKNKILLCNAIQTAYANSDNSPSFSLMALSAFLKQKGYQVELLLNIFSDAELKNVLKNCLTVDFSLFTGCSKNANSEIARCELRKITLKDFRKKLLNC